MKRLLAVLALLAVFLSGCGAEYGPERTVKKMLGALQGGNIAKAEACTFDGTLNIDRGNWTTSRFYKRMFKTIRYSIAETTVDGSSAEVVVTVTMVDMSVLVSAATFDLLEGAIAGERSTGRQFYKTLTKAIQEDDAEYATSTVTVCLTKSKNDWQVVMAESSEFADAITGGLGKLIGY